ncbi:MAG: hypothetical protein PGN29_19070 [Gordonia paraffinivorans]
MDRLAAIDAVIAVNDADSELWAREIDAVYDRLGGPERLIHALADLVIDGVAAEYRGDWVAIRRALRDRRDLIEAESRPEAV